MEVIETFDTKGKTPTGLWMALSLGSSFLYTGVMSDSFKVSHHFFFSKVWLIHFVSFKKQNLMFLVC